jgi:DivIVA domain-containing protein
VENDSIERIRSATFAVSRRGYDKREVDSFLSRLADWLEAGGGDRARSDTVRRELERVGQKTARILTDAEETAQQIRGEAENEAKETRRSVNSAAEATRKEADTYSKQTHETADDYSQKTRAAADQYDAQTRAESDAYSNQARTAADEYSQGVRSEADRQSIDTVKAGEAKAQRIIEDGVKRRQDIEAVISDLVRRRDAVLAEVDKLTAELQTAVSHHRPVAGGDEFSRPAELDPAVREAHDTQARQVLGSPDGIEETEPTTARQRAAAAQPKASAKS